MKRAAATHAGKSSLSPFLQVVADLACPRPRRLPIKVHTAGLNVGILVGIMAGGALEFVSDIQPYSVRIGLHGLQGLETRKLPCLGVPLGDDIACDGKGKGMASPKV